MRLFRYIIISAISALISLPVFAQAIDKSIVAERILQRGNVAIDSLEDINYSINLLEDVPYKFEKSNTNTLFFSFTLNDAAWELIGPDNRFFDGMVQGYFADNSPEVIMPLLCLYYQKGTTVSFINESTGKDKSFNLPYARLAAIFRATLPSMSPEDTPPMFQGKDRSAFPSWVNSRLKYPEFARKNKIQGTVTVALTIDVDGSVVDVHVIKGANSLLDAEAVRVVKSSPKWTPGYRDGKPVKVTFSFPVVFQLR